MTNVIPSQYKKIISEIAELYENAKRSQLEFYWQVGRRIVQVEQDGAVRARYGSGLLSQLSEDLTETCGHGFSVRHLTRMRSFYLENTSISTTSSKLAFSQNVELMRIENRNKRRELAKRVLRENLNVNELRKLVRFAKAEEREVPKKPLKHPVLGEFHTCRLIKLADGSSKIDFGFDVHLNPKLAEGLKCVEKPSYTYRAILQRIIDGDTLVVEIELGAGVTTKQKLRLRGIDCPELKTAEGKRAKAFVEKVLGSNSTKRGTVPEKRGQALVIKSSQSDKFDRYLADVFYGMDEDVHDPRRAVPELSKLRHSMDEDVHDPRRAVPELSKLRYLNQELLDKKLAIRYDGEKAKENPSIHSEQPPKEKRPVPREDSELAGTGAEKGSRS